MPVSKCYQRMGISFRQAIHCKNIRISTHILWRVVRISTEPVPYPFVSVNRRTNEARAHLNIRGYTDIFTVYFFLVSSPLVNVHITHSPHSPDLTSADLISSQPSGCEATQFAAAATSQNAAHGKSRQ